MIVKSQLWQKSAIATAALALLSLYVTEASALSLGRLTVLSALGEPLRAEIDVPEINAEEASSLKAGIAKPAAFVAAGLEYNAAMSNLQSTLERRPDGRAFIRLSSDRSINDPFVDIILEATWSSGRIVRDYTMLLDPPALRQPAASAPTLPQTAPAPVATSPVQAPVVQALTPAPAPTAIEPVVEASRKPAPPKPASSKSTQASAPAKVAAVPRVESASQVVVKPGDTASKIVGNTKTTGVSLDQMLVALLRSNPDAFVNGNLNRVRAGAVVNIPTAEQALSVSSPEATQIVVAQSKDFNDFRRTLATAAPSAPVAAASRTASGSVEAKVEDKKAAAPTPDKLTLSKGTLQSKTDEAKIAKERADKDAQARAAEISKNISDLEKLKAAAAPAPSPAPAPTPALVKAPAEVTPPPQTTVAPTVAVAAPPVAAPAPAAADPEPKVVAPSPAAAPSKPPASAAAPEVEPPGLIDELLQVPLILAGVVGLLAILGSVAFYRMRQRKKKAAHVDSSFLESRLQPDSFFGASGGQRVDTNNGNSVGGSSMVYSASQLDAADDVDPVAEADVYLAYGRDLQAEEILKEAVRTTPRRLAIHTKLLDIFAKRRDAKSFEATAMQAFRLAGRNSLDWARACELGLSIDPNNPLYQPGGAPDDSSLIPLDTNATSPSFSSTVPHMPAAEAGVAAGGVDLDLDFSLDEEPVSAISDLTGASLDHGKYDQTIKLSTPAAQANDLEMDFDLSEPAPLSANPKSYEPTSSPEISLSMDGISLTEKRSPTEDSFGATNSMPVQAQANKSPELDSGMLEFDLGSLSLDLDTSSPDLTHGPSAENEDPMGTKLALAEEFISIGDEDGARALIEEVVAESSGEVRAKAQRALASLS